MEVFGGELHDDKTLPSQIAKLKDRFGLRRVVVVSDRGMVTKANLELMRTVDGTDWITALKAPQIQKLAGRARYSSRYSIRLTSARSPRRTTQASG